MTHTEGDTCPHCYEGHLTVQQGENCSCHIAPPCGSCFDAPLICSECRSEIYHDEDPAPVIVSQEARQEAAEKAFLKMKAKAAEERARKKREKLLAKRMADLKAILERPLDTDCIDFRPVFCSPISETLEGVYPEGTTQEQVLTLIEGPHGGRFTEWGEGRFKFISNIR